jgi:hypothetical protein
VCSLVAYLSGRGQTPMLATADNVAGFFNGKDLTGWRSARGQWKITDGVIVAPGPEGKNLALLISDLAAGDFHLSLEVNPGKNGRGYIVIRGKETAELPLSPVVTFAAGKGINYSGGGLSKPLDADGKIQADAWNKLDIIAAGERLQVLLNGKKQLEYEKTWHTPRRGLIALEGSTESGQEIRFRNLHLKLLPGKDK